MAIGASGCILFPMLRIFIKIEEILVAGDADAVADLLAGYVAICAEHPSFSVHGLLVAVDRRNLLQKEIRLNRNVVVDRADFCQSRLCETISFNVTITTGGRLTRDIVLISLNEEPLIYLVTLFVVLLQICHEGTPFSRVDHAVFVSVDFQPVNLIIVRYRYIDFYAAGCNRCMTCHALQPRQMYGLDRKGCMRYFRMARSAVLFLLIYVMDLMTFFTFHAFLFVYALAVNRPGSRCDNPRRRASSAFPCEEVRSHQCDNLRRKQSRARKLCNRRGTRDNHRS